MGVHPKSVARIAALKVCGASGMYREDAARMLGIGRAAIAAYRREYGDFGFVHAGTQYRREPTDREDTMRRLYQNGHSLQEIGDHFGITRERVRQLLTKHYGFNAESGGASIAAQRRDARKQVERDARAFRKYGCTAAEVLQVKAIQRQMVKDGYSRYQTPFYAFYQQKQNAKQRGIPWTLTFWQWWTVWQESGRWWERGRGHGYAMCRYGDQGGYEPGNVYIATNPDNIRDCIARFRLEGRTWGGPSLRETAA